MPTREDHEIALALAREEFARKDPRKQAERAGVTWTPVGQGEGEDGYAEVPFLGTLYRVQSPYGHVSYREERGGEPALWERILLLHYINTSDGTPLANEYISFKELREAMLYLPNFEKRAVAPLLGRFGRDPQEIWAVASAIGGSKEALGDFSVKIPAFPRVPVALVFWKADAEFGPRLTVLFDRTVVRYLPAEDIVLVTQMMAYRLIGLAGRKN